MIVPCSLQKTRDSKRLFFAVVTHFETDEATVGATENRTAAEIRTPRRLERPRPARNDPAGYAVCCVVRASRRVSPRPYFSTLRYSVLFEIRSCLATSVRLP